MGPLHFSVLTLMYALVLGHLVGDYPLQGDFLARAKNHKAPIAGVPWWLALASHAAIQGGIVWAITGSGALGVAEYVVHFLIDDAKCAGVLGLGERGFIVDQLLHVLCKAVWVSLMLHGAV